MQHLCIAALLLSAVAAQLDADPKGPDFMPGEPGVRPPGTLRGPAGERSPNRRPVGPDFMPGGPGVRGPAGERRPNRRPVGPDPMTGEPGVRSLEALRGPAGDRRPNRRPMELSPVFKVDGVAFEATPAVPLKEGETMFRMVRPRDGEEGPRPEEKRRGGRREPGQYVKLSYKTMEPNKVSIEFGVMKPVKPGELVRDEDIFEDDY